MVTPWLCVGDVSGAQKNKRKPLEKSWRRSEGSLRPEGPRARSEHGGLYELGSGTEESRRQKARSRGASKISTRLNGINGITENRWELQVVENGAGDGTRTRDVQLGKLAFYH